MLILTGIIIFIIDILFITYIFSHEYKPLIKSVQKSTMEVNYISALMTYLIMICGLYYFIIKDRRSILDAVILGMFVYGVFCLDKLFFAKELVISSSCDRYCMGWYFVWINNNGITIY